MTLQPIPVSDELWLHPNRQVLGKLYDIDWGKIYSPVAEPPVKLYFAVDTLGIWRTDWSNSLEDQGFFVDGLIHLGLKRAYLHRALLLKINLNAVRSVFNNQCVMEGKMFRAPYQGDLAVGAKVWCVGLGKLSHELTWDNSVPQQLLRAYGLLHLNEQECVMHRQCWIETNLRGIKNATSV